MVDKVYHNGVVVVVLLLACSRHAAATHDSSFTSSRQFSNQTIEREFNEIRDVVSNFIEAAFKTSPINETLISILRTYDESSQNNGRSARVRRSPGGVVIAAFVKIMWQFVNGIAKPFLKTYLAPVQMLFTFLSPVMLLRDCYYRSPPPLPPLAVARTLAPFTIGPAAQNFFWCAVDIVAQVILCIKLLANMTPSIF